MKKITHFIGVILFVAVSSVAYAESQNGVESAKIITAIKRGAAWLIAQDFRRKDVIAFSDWLHDDLVIIDAAAAKRLREKSMAAFHDGREEDPMLRNMIGGKTLLPPGMDEWARDHLAELEARREAGKLGISAGGTQDFLLISLYANDPLIRGHFDSIYHELFTHKYDRYGTTHQLLALHFLRSRNVFDAAQIDLAIDKFSHQMAAELDSYVAKGQFIDLIAEQMAFLGLVGHEDLMTTRHINFLLAHQHSDGGWRQAETESNFRDQRDMHQHATILSLYALLHYLRHIGALSSAAAL